MAGIVVPAPVPSGRTPSRWRRAALVLRRSWPWVRYLVGLALAGVALGAVLGQRGELSGFSSALGHLRPWWVVIGLVAEVGSYLSFATAQRRLLAVGGVDVGVGPMAVIVLVATTISNSMPAGSVLSTVFSFRQFRRRGADDTVAAWSLVAVLVAAGASLGLMAAVGLAIAGAEGAGDDLLGVTAGVVVVALAAAVLLVQRRAVSWVVRMLVRVLPDRLALPVDAGLDRLVTVQLNARQMAGAIAWTGGNWVLDCGCLAASFLAVGAPVPWHGLLLAYGVGQLAANLPVTPGGLGLVEGSMTIALVAFGGDVVSTAVAVLVYRVMSYWLELPLGWVVWGRLVWRERRELPPGPGGPMTVPTQVAGRAGPGVGGAGLGGATGSGGPVGAAGSGGLVVDMARAGGGAVDLPGARGPAVGAAGSGGLVVDMARAGGGAVGGEFAGLGARDSSGTQGILLPGASGPPISPGAVVSGPEPPLQGTAGT